MRQQNFLLAAVVGLFSVAWLLPYFQVVGFAFVNWDDGIHVSENPTLRGTGTLRDAWLTPGLGYPIPVTVALYRCVHAAVGFAPWAYHALNLGLFALLLWLLFALARRHKISWFFSLFACGLVAVSPVTTEPVAWVTGTKDLLSMGIVLALLSYSVARLDVRWSESVLLGFGVFAKPSAAAYLPIRALQLRLQQHMSLSNMARRVWPLALIVVVAATLGVLGQRAVGAIDTRYSLLQIARNVWWALGFHTMLALGLTPPSAKHMPVQWPPAFGAPDLVALATIAGITLLYRLHRMEHRTRGKTLLGMIVFLYLPSSGVLPLVRGIADSYAFALWVPLSLFIASALDSRLGAMFGRLETSRQKLAGLTLWLVTALLGMLQLNNVARYENSETLWRSAYQLAPHSGLLCKQYTQALWHPPNLVRALQQTDLCIERFGDALFAKNRAILLGQLGRWPEALPAIEHALVQRPNDAALLRYRAAALAAARGMRVVLDSAAPPQ